MKLVTAIVVFYAIPFYWNPLKFEYYTFVSIFLLNNRMELSYDYPNKTSKAAIHMRDVLHRLDAFN